MGEASYRACSGNKVEELSNAEATKRIRGEARTGMEGLGSGVANARWADGLALLRQLTRGRRCRELTQERMAS